MCPIHSVVLSAICGADKLVYLALAYFSVDDMYQLDLISFTNSNPGSSNLHNTTCGMTEPKTVGLVDRTHRAVDAAAYSLCMCLCQLPGFGVACGESDFRALQVFFQVSRHR